MPLVGALPVLRLVASRLDVAVASMATIGFFFFFLSLSLADSSALAPLESASASVSI